MSTNNERDAAIESADKHIAARNEAWRKWDEEYESYRPASTRTWKDCPDCKHTVFSDETHICRTPASSEAKALKVKLDTPEAKQRWEQIKQASAEVDSWPAVKRVEAGNKCPCDTECGHPVTRHRLVIEPGYGKTVCDDCPPPAPADGLEDARAFLTTRYPALAGGDFLVWMVDLMGQYAAERVSAAKAENERLMKLLKQIFQHPPTPADGLREAALAYLDKFGELKGREREYFATDMASFAAERVSAAIESYVGECEKDADYRRREYLREFGIDLPNDGFLREAMRSVAERRKK